MHALLVHKDFSDIRYIPGIEHISNVELYSSFIREEVEAKGLCGGLNRDYIRSSLKHADWILVVIDAHDEDHYGLGVRGDMMGFATLYRKPEAVFEGCLYIDIFCTVPGKGVGKFMMAILDYMKDAYAFRRLCLCSLEDAIGFYDKMGFDFADNLDISDEACGSDMPLMMRTGGGRKRGRKIMFTRGITDQMAKTRRAHRKNSRKASRKTSRKETRKTRKATQAGGKRSEWLQKVMRVYKEMKAKNPKTRLGDAMRAAKKMH